MNDGSLPLASRASVPTCVAAVIAAAVLLTGCIPTPAVAPDANSPTTVPGARTIAAAGDGYMYKVCDEGRAVYVWDGYKAGGIAVVENAAECQAEASQ